uniref:NAC domain-containing protein n=1 Tax=Kalanchoe fedtschenkoi TaxID=63787 RepID=A0A7N0TPF0_KALFE
MDRHAVADLPPLPPGCRFHPSDDQLIRYYLLKKNGNGAAAAAASDDRIDGYGFDVIKEVDVGKYNPFDLPEWCCYCYGYKGRKRHWYGYRMRAVKERLVRMTASGFWKRRGRVRDVVGYGGGVVLGKRVSFAFYLGNLAEGAVRTNWYMHEYALVDPKAFVLCRVFVKFRRGHASNASEHALCSFAHKNVGVQHDETVTSDVEGAKACDINSVDRGIQTSSMSSGRMIDKDDMKDPGPDSGFHLQLQSGSHLLAYPVGSSMTEHEKSSDGLILLGESSDVLTSEHLDCILEEDFIELNDLLSPLPENDDT